MYNLQSIYDLVLYCCKGRIIYKWIVAKSKLQTESELQYKIWAGLAISWQASPIFILQFTFSLNSLVHDPAQSPKNDL